MEPFASYIEAARTRAVERQARTDLAASQARRVLPALVAHLVTRYGATKIQLVGSLARGRFAEGSDIDLLVAGLEDHALYRAGAELEDLARPFRVDLIPEEDAYPEVLARMREYAECLYGQP